MEQQRRLLVARLQVRDPADDDVVDAVRRQVAGIIGSIVTRERRVAVNRMLVRAGEQTW